MKRGNRNKVIRKQSKQRGRMLAAMIAVTMILFMGCNGEGQAADGTENSAETAEVTGTTALSDEAAPQEPETETENAETNESEDTGAVEAEAERMEHESVEAVEEDEAGLEESAESGVTEEADELTALYNDYQDKDVLDFSQALREIGYDQICLINCGHFPFTRYFSVVDGNYYTFPDEELYYADSLFLYIPNTPTEFSCDNENIWMGVYAFSLEEYDEESDTGSYLHRSLTFSDGEFDVFSTSATYQPDEDDYKLTNQITLDCSAFEGNDVPVNISVTFEDGSTQEITVYLTRHAE